MLTQIALVLTFGFTACAPRVMELMLRTTLGIGNDPMKPSVFDFVIWPARVPIR